MFSNILSMYRIAVIQSRFQFVNVSFVFLSLLDKYFIVYMYAYRVFHSLLKYFQCRETLKLLLQVPTQQRPSFHMIYSPGGAGSKANETPRFALYLALICLFYLPFITCFVLCKLGLRMAPCLILHLYSNFQGNISKHVTKQYSLFTRALLLKMNNKIT